MITSEQISSDIQDAGPRGRKAWWDWDRNKNHRNQDSTLYIFCTKANNISGAQYVWQDIEEDQK